MLEFLKPWQWRKEVLQIEVDLAVTTLVVIGEVPVTTTSVCRWFHRGSWRKWNWKSFLVFVGKAFWVCNSFFKNVMWYYYKHFEQNDAPRLFMYLVFCTIHQFSGDQMTRQSLLVFEIVIIIYAFPFLVLSVISDCHRLSSIFVYLIAIRAWQWIWWRHSFC